MSLRFRLICGTMMLLALITISAQAGTTSVYTTDASFLAAAGGGLTFESFETATNASPTLVNFPGGTFGCVGTSFCPGFFGISTIFADTGVQSVFFASPDQAVFTFNSPINAFGIAIGGAGDVSPNTTVATLSNGDSAYALLNWTGPFVVFGANRAYFGIIDSVPFTSVTFTPNNSGDGIFFDSMSYGLASTTPEPGTMVMFGSGVLGLAGVLRRKFRM
jgi:hypothetical protein